MSAGAMDTVDAPFARRFLHRLAPTSDTLTFETAEFSRFRNGLLAHHTVVLDMLDLARQIGAVPQAGTLAASVGLWMQHVSAFRARMRQGGSSLQP